MHVDRFHLLTKCIYGLVILDKCKEIDQCPHIISKSETEGAVWYKILVKIVYS